MEEKKKIQNSIVVQCPIQMFANGFPTNEIVKLNGQHTTMDLDIGHRTQFVVFD